VVLCDQLFCDVRVRIGERLQQHLDNLDLWNQGILNASEPDEHERECVVRELKAAIAELKPLAQMCGMWHE
jgi:hypothetical protein